MKRFGWRFVGIVAAILVTVSVGSAFFRWIHHPSPASAGNSERVQATQQDSAKPEQQDSVAKDDQLPADAAEESWFVRPPDTAQLKRWSIDQAREPIYETNDADGNKVALKRLTVKNNDTGKRYRITVWQVGSPQREEQLNRISVGQRVHFVMIDRAVTIEVGGNPPNFMSAAEGIVAEPGQFSRFSSNLPHASPAVEPPRQGVEEPPQGAAQQPSGQTRPASGQKVISILKVKLGGSRDEVSDAIADHSYDGLRCKKINSSTLCSADGLFDSSVLAEFTLSNQLYQLTSIHKQDGHKIFLHLKSDYMNHLGQPDSVTTPKDDQSEGSFAWNLDDGSKLTLGFVDSLHESITIWCSPALAAAAEMKCGD